MVNLKNYNLVVKHFVLLLTFISLVSCERKLYTITTIKGEKNAINEKQKANLEIENFIQPYRENINKDLNEILAYCPETLEKSKGEWQTNIGSFLADITLEKSNKIFTIREKKTIDICLLNHGGIRSIIPKGNVTARNAFEVMPFENSAIVIALNANQIMEIAKYIIAEKKPHPLAGMRFTIDRNNEVKNLLVQGKPLGENKIYYVVTSDYLANGGDNMVFFKKGIQKFDLDYKLRNIMIDYFKEVDTLKINTDSRISKE